MWRGGRCDVKETGGGRQYRVIRYWESRIRVGYVVAQESRITPIGYRAEGSDVRQVRSNIARTVRQGKVHGGNVGN